MLTSESFLIHWKRNEIPTGKPQRTRSLNESHFALWELFLCMHEVKSVRMARLKKNRQRLVIPERSVFIPLCHHPYDVFLPFISDEKRRPKKTSFSNSNRDRRQKTSCKDFFIHSMCAREPSRVNKRAKFCLCFTLSASLQHLKVKFIESFYEKPFCSCSVFMKSEKHIKERLLGCSPRSNPKRHKTFAIKII